MPGQKRVLVQVDDEAALRRLSQEALRHRRVLGCIDRLWTAAAGGPIQVRPRLPARSAQDLALVHTTGANRLASTIAAVPETEREVTDAVVDLSDPGLLTPQLVTVMAARPVVFTLSSPEPRWHPDLLADRAAVIATAHPEHPNYLTKALAFPGLTRGVLNSRAPRITTAMHLATADGQGDR